MSSPSSSSSAAARAVTVTAEEGEERRAASRCKGGDGGMTEIEDLTLYPAVPFYGPSTIRGLKPGETKRWCTCGLSKQQPWCDNSHRGTPFKPLIWKVPENQQTLYSICACKYTKSPPFCDTRHVDCPIEVYRRQKACAGVHDKGTTRLCTSCGWTPDTPEVDL